MDKLKYVKLENEDGSYSPSIPLSVDSNYIEINGVTLSKALEDKADNSSVIDSVNSLQTEISSLASGGPAGVYATLAALVAANPNHSRIYLVTENGHWYYYNNAEWQDGGVYQGEKLNERDANSLYFSASNIGNLIGTEVPLLEMGNIDISYNGWNYNDSYSATKRVRIKQGYAIHLRPGDKIKLTDYSDARMYIGFWRYDWEAYSTPRQWLTEDYTVLYEGDYVVLLAHINERVLSSVYELADLLKIESNNKIEDLQTEITELDKLGTRNSYLKSILEIGGVSPSGFDHINTRISLKKVQKFPYELEVTLDENYSGSYRLYTSDINPSDATLIIDSGYLGNHFVIPKDSYFSLTFKKNDNSVLDLLSFRNLLSFNAKEEEIIIPDMPEVIPNYNFFDTPVYDVNHRGYNRIAPENTLSAYKLSKQHGFDAVECDIRLTSDKQCVILHDPTVDRTSNGTGAIKNISFEDARALDFGSWKSSEYAGEKIPTFEEYISLCRKINLHAYIEIEGDAGFTQEIINNLVQIAKNYGMLRKITWISFTPSMLTLVKNADPGARLGILRDSYNSNGITDYQNLKSKFNYVFISWNYSTLTTELLNTYKGLNIPVEVWVANTEEAILGLDPYITGVTSDILIAKDVLYNSIISNE